MASQRPVIEKALSRNKVKVSNQTFGQDLDPNWPECELFIEGNSTDTVVIFSSADADLDREMCSRILAEKKAKVLFVYQKGYALPADPVVTENLDLFTSIREFDHPMDTARFIAVLAKLPDFSDNHVCLGIENYLGGFRYHDLNKVAGQELTFWATVQQQQPIENTSPAANWHIAVFKDYLPVVSDMSGNRNIVLNGAYKVARFSFGVKTQEQGVTDHKNRLNNLPTVGSVGKVAVAEYDGNE